MLTRGIDPVHVLDLSKSLFCDRPEEEMPEAGRNASTIANGGYGRNLRSVRGGD